MPQYSLVSVNVGRPHIVIRGGRQYSTAIDRRPVEGRVEAGTEGLADDRVSDTRVHGGPDKAVCCYPHEHYSWLAARLAEARGSSRADPGSVDQNSTTRGAELPVPSFGENFTIRGLLEREACLGDRFRIGTATFELSQPRQPCAKLAGKHAEPRIIGWINETGFCGFYLRVLETGHVAAGDEITLLDRRLPDLSVAALLSLRLALEPDRAMLQRLSALPQLSLAWKHWVDLALSSADGPPS